MSSLLPEGKIPNSDGSETNLVSVANTRCIVCGEPCSGWTMAIGRPYYAVVHWNCRAGIPNHGDYPHEQPLAHFHPSSNILSLEPKTNDG